MSASKSSNPGLVVPVDVVAFCVSAADARDTAGTNSFAGATVDYRLQTNSTIAAYLGTNISRGLDTSPLNALEAGVHIHWALPDALTNAAVDEQTTTIDFPAVPNRWLVTRVVVDGATPSLTSWVVESDALSASSPSAPLFPTVALAPGTDDQDYAYVGRSTPLASYQPSVLLNGPRTFMTATGAELSVVANGTPIFASYYPESRTAFGFVDPLDDISGTASLMYVVTGWFDHTANDPATTGNNLQDTYQWQTEGDAAYTLYSGMVQDVAWDPDRDYVLSQPNQGAIAAEAAMGNTPIEAISAYFRGLDKPDVQFFEQILCAFQEGLLPRFTEQGPGVLARLAEALHNNGFQKIDAGQIYSIVAEVGDTEEEATDLPVPIAIALNQLNQAARTLEEAATAVESFQWAMFADWYRYFQASDNTDQIFNHAADLYTAWTDTDPANSPKVRYDQAQAALTRQVDALTTLLADTPLILKPVPAPRYWRPTDPAVLLASQELQFPARHGSDGLLACRATDQLVSTVTVGSAQINGSDFALACALPAAKLPYAPDCAALLMEACLLNTRIAAHRSGQNEAVLTADLQALLDGRQQASWTIAAGQAPSPVELTWWGPQNPWLPLFLSWSVDFEPLQPTENTDGLTPYPAELITAHYQVDPATGSFVRYTPGVIDPGALSFNQSWAGYSILSPTTADNLAAAIADYVQGTPDPTLQQILGQLNQTLPLVQPLSGFTSGLLMQQQIPQLQIAVPSDADFSSTTLTGYAQEVVGPSYHVGPQFNWPYNPLRAGWLKLSLEAVDTFGQRRRLDLSTTMAESMTAQGPDGPLADVAYVAPRLAQPGRLLFEWISAGAGGLMEMNDHPAMSPVCGWLLPNHLEGGFFLYDGAGRPLGSLQLNGDQSRVIWQSAPGNDATIDQDVDQALADVNPTFRALAVALAAATPAWFRRFSQAVDKVHGGISPEMLATNAGLPILIGRPVAVAQCALKLDMRGRTALDQRWTCLGDDGWTDTDGGFQAVQYPVLLGDADDLDDGLIGFFGPSVDGYDFSTFFTDGASSEDQSGVVQPQQTTLLLQPSPTFDPKPQPMDERTTSVLLLIDPRAPVHATTGILPTESLQIPPDVAAAAVSQLEMSFLVAPILRPASLQIVPPENSVVGRLTLPIPREPGYAVSFLEQDKDENGPRWTTISDIGDPPGGAVWDYTPQTLTEGWLRLNPILLSFDLLNGDGKALVAGGATQSLTLRVTNRKPVPVTFQPGRIVTENQPLASGSIFYLHFGVLVDQADVTAMALTASGWTFQAVHDDIYGNYWAATPTAAVELTPGQFFDVAITNLKAVSTAVQAKVYADYYGVDGVSDGVFPDLVTISKPGS